MKTATPLAPTMQPTQHTITLDIDEELLDAAERELYAKATDDSNHCYGYFPGMKGKDGIDTELSACKALHDALPMIQIADKQLSCNFIRLSLVKQQGDFPFHLDTDAATALTGDKETLNKRKVWRILLNLSTKHPRTLSYIDADPNTVELDYGNGYLHCVDEQAMNERKQSVQIPPRTKTQVSGVLFCSSRVLHTGVDDDNGHFVAGFGCEEPD
jgi:hypothetical protein